MSYRTSGNANVPLGRTEQILADLDQKIATLALNGGAVASVNGKTGVVALVASDVGAAPTATRTAFGDASATISAGTRTIALSTAFTAARTLTLPAASGQPVGQPLYLVDEVGAISSANTLTLAAAGSDTLNGVASVTYATGRPVLELFSDGASKWSIGVRPVAGGGTGSNTAAGARANLGAAYSAPVRSGYWMSPPAGVGGQGYLPTPNGATVFVAFDVPRAGTLAGIGIQITTAGTTEARVRFVVYTDSDGDGVPDTLALDAGVIDGSVLGFQSVTSSLAVTAQRYFVAAVSQLVTGGYPKAPTLTPEMIVVDTPGSYTYTGGSAWQFSGITGAAPATLSAASATIAVATPRLWIKLS